MHESGHAAVALVLGLDIDHLELSLIPGGDQGWCGHCVLVGDGPVNARFAAMDAFCLAGPICQLLLAPNSLDGHAATFCPSIFSRIPDHFADRGAVINHLHWQSDLIESGIVNAVPNAPLQWRLHDERNRGTRPWLTELDPHLRKLFALPEIESFIRALVPELVNAPDKRLMPAKLADLYNANVPTALTESLRRFIAAQPDAGPPPIHQFVMPKANRPHENRGPTMGL